MKKNQKRTIKRKAQESFSSRLSRVFIWIQKKVTVIFILQTLVTLAVFSLITRLYELQVIQGEEYKDQLITQHSNVDRGTKLNRGEIYFKDKNGYSVLAATTKNTYTLAINPSRITDPEALYKEAHKIISIDRDDFITKAKKANDPYEEILKSIDEEKMKLLRAITYPGLVLIKNEERFYPGGKLGSSVLGFMSFNGDDFIGSYGLEKYYDQILRRDGALKTSGLFAAIFNPEIFAEQKTEKKTIKKELSKEASLLLTIEPTVQAYLEEQLVAVQKRWKARYAAGVIMDPRTGEIIAMGTSDHFDPNKEIRHYRNYLIEDRLELGSIIKPLTIAVGLDSGTINENFTYSDTGSMVLSRRKISNFDGKGRGPNTNLQTILTNSLNTGVATIALEVGVTEFRNRFKGLGLGEETGIDLPGEVYGLIENIESNREIEIATASFGQGIAITPIESLRALSSIANGGHLVTPYVVDSIEYGDLIPSKNSVPGGTKKVFSESSVEIVTDLMVGIVDESDTFSPYKNPDYAVAIKTGTAQIAEPKGGYYDDRFLHSFVGFFPAYADEKSEKFIVLLYIVEPQGAQYSSTTLKESFFSISEFLIHYFDIPPDRLNQINKLQF